MAMSRQTGAAIFLKTYEMFICRCIYYISSVFCKIMLKIMAD